MSHFNQLFTSSLAARQAETQPAKADGAIGGKAPDGAIAGKAPDGISGGGKAPDGSIAGGRATGVVRWFSRMKGYGFINPDDGGREVFVHYSAIDGEGYRNLYEGDQVEFDLVDRGRGPQAQNVTVQQRW